MSTKTLVDTVFVIALINRRDQYHERALSLADEFEGYPLLVTEAVLLEIGNALARSYKREAIEIIEQFLNADEVEVVRLTPELFGQAFVLYKQCQDKEWSLVDCISFTVMREAGLHRALTSDQHFMQAGFDALM